MTYWDCCSFTLLLPGTLLYLVFWPADHCPLTTCITLPFLMQYVPLFHLVSPIVSMLDCIGMLVNGLHCMALYISFARVVYFAMVFFSFYYFSV